MHRFLNDFLMYSITQKKTPSVNSELSLRLKHPGKRNFHILRNKAELETITRLPKFVWLLLISFAIAHVGFVSILGYRLSGWTWVITLIVSVFIVAKNPKRSVFPMVIWMPWTLYLFLNLLFSEYDALQRTVQLISPVIIGTAVSTYRIQPKQAERFIRVCCKFSIILFFLGLYRAGVFLTGRIPNVTGLAGHSMTMVLLCCLFAVAYAFGEKKTVRYWLLGAGYTFFSMVRITILAAFITLPLSLMLPGRVRIPKRIWLFFLFLLVAIAVFSSDRFQSKMFRSGSGTIQDISYYNMNLTDSGRRFMWAQLWWNIIDKPWLGYGAGSGEYYTMFITGDRVPYPHNDYLLTLHDYGIFGLFLFLLTIVAAMTHAYKKSKNTALSIRMLFITGVLSFAVFLVMMITDNIMVYNNFYGNFQFTIL